MTAILCFSEFSKTQKWHLEFTFRLFHFYI